MYANFPYRFHFKRKDRENVIFLSFAPHYAIPYLLTYGNPSLHMGIRPASPPGIHLIDFHGF